MEKTCGTCLYFVPRWTGKKGRCHKDGFTTYEVSTRNPACDEYRPEKVEMQAEIEETTPEER